jgi:acyl transferase domain-containing protein
MYNTATSSNLNGFEIAIIGMSGRFPGAGNLEEFWQNRRAGVESVTYFSDAELAAAGVAGPVPRSSRVLADAETTAFSVY